MGRYEIEGGVRLSGKIKTESAKNALLPIIAASMLTDEEVVILDCPPLKDVVSMIKILNHLGVKTTYQENNLIINSDGINGYTVPYEMTSELRSSILTLGALLSRLNKADIAYPGGCEIGKRPIDIHLDAFSKMGYNVFYENKRVVCSGSQDKDCEIYLGFPSVGATENIILASSLSNKKTVIHNAAREPEIVDLCSFIVKMGGKIKGAGSPTITIEGVKLLKGTSYRAIPDRIEAGTYLIAGAITGGEIEVSNVRSKNLLSFISKLCDNTCKIKINNDIIYLKSGFNHSFDIVTGPYPMFPTDLQAQMMTLASVCKGVSNIRENVFEMRFNHIEQLKKMGANINIENRIARVCGVERLFGAKVEARDLRGGAALVLAGLNAEGKTVVENVEHIKRGYFKFDEKLNSLGANVKEK